MACFVVRHLVSHLAGYLSCHLRTPIEFLPPQESADGEIKEEAEDSIGDDGAETVMRRLGLWESSGEVGGGRGLRLAVEEAHRLLEEKEATLEELEEAFGVFDEDGDGVIGDVDLRSVMRRLGFEEGSELEECRRMIEAYDEDGDGGISFSEFRRMLEKD